MIVRRATARDAPQCAGIHVRSWRAGYHGMLPDEYLESLTDVDRLPWWELQLGEGGEPALEVFVAEDIDGSLRGFAAACPDGADPSVGVIAQLYVDPDAWGTGVARDLLTAATDNLKARSFAVATLSVARGNARARRFYEREGWHATGIETSEQLWGVSIVTAEYRREL